MAASTTSPSNSEHTAPNPAQARLPKLTPEFLSKHYPSSISLVHVDVLTRHGERTPIARNFENLSPRYWDFCKVGNQLHADFIKKVGLHTSIPPPTGDKAGADQERKWANYMFKVESRNTKAVFGVSDKKDKPKDTDDTSKPSAATCGFGQLTDVGRQSMTALGQHLRSLYVESTDLLPSMPRNGEGGPTGDLYLRSTSYSRAFESLQHTLGGLYPNALDVPSLFRVNVRPSTRDNLLISFDCKSMMRLFKAFNANAKEASLGEYNALHQDLVKIDGLREFYESQPNDSKGPPAAIHAWDTLASMRAHNMPLPSAIDDALIARTSEMSGVEYLHSGWQSAALTRLQIGPLVHELVGNIVRAVEVDRAGAFPKSDSSNSKMGIYSGHDTTIGPLLAVFGARSDDSSSSSSRSYTKPSDPYWPPYAASIRLELIKDDNTQPPTIRPAWEDHQAYHSEDLSMVPFGSRIRPINVPDSLYNWSSARNQKQRRSSPATDHFNPRAMRDYYVRVWYNDRELQLPACLDPGAHHATLGTTMCTVDGFFKQVARFVPSEEEAARGCNGE
ncbi:hypothetical protein EV175_003439 [Coemansia sp. RSA 1933]|nr:hypothetical protein EV175_003439 [Coemansia sp. RSA 1933]